MTILRNAFLLGVTCLTANIGSAQAALRQSSSSQALPTDAAAAAAVTDITEDDATTVSVRFYGEAECPYCRKFVTEVWPDIWSDEELRAAVDYDFIPWGNAYFATEDCGKGPTYNSAERQCWHDKCLDNGDVDDAGYGGDDDECFSGGAIYQHGEREGQVNIYESCVKEELGLTGAIKFMACVEGPNMDDRETTAKELLAKCLNLDDPELNAFQICFDKRGKQIEIDNAKNTPAHKGVPYVVVEGEALENPFTVKDAICASLKVKNAATLPKACADIESEGDGVEPLVMIS